MQVVDEFPRTTREIESMFIELADGCRLAARIWLPADAKAERVPAILEYLPYRKRDGTSQRDTLSHPYFAGHGYACVRVDMRGNGESDGLMLDEYTEQEQDDALEVIDWIAREPWCNGAAGMIGISLGGFNGLQVAARCPPALNAVITLCSTDDRYADDTHFMGGCLLNDNLSWASTMFAYSSRPPDPALLGERWRELWLHRLEHTVLLVEEWLRHQRRDRQWQHGSVRENFAAIQCPVFAVGGWADGYSNAIPRLLAGLEVPRKGLMGPWAHKYPHFATPGPQIGFLQECLRWWDHWLKGIDTGIMDEPMYRVWMQESVPPRAHYDEHPGRWVAEPSWPSPNIAALDYAPGRGRGPGRRERQRQDHADLGGGEAARRQRRDPRRADPVRGPRRPGPRPRRAAAAARRAHRHGVPGPDDRAQSGADDRDPGDRRPVPGAGEQGREAPPRSRCCGASASRTRSVGSTATRTSSRAACASASASRSR